jgi:hypothetical protein
MKKISYCHKEGMSGTYLLLNQRICPICGEDIIEYEIRNRKVKRQVK